MSLQGVAVARAGKALTNAQQANDPNNVSVSMTICVSVDSKEPGIGQHAAEVGYRRSFKQCRAVSTGTEGKW